MNLPRELIEFQHGLAHIAPATAVLLKGVPLAETDETGELINSETVRIDRLMWQPPESTTTSFLAEDMHQVIG